MVVFACVTVSAVVILVASDVIKYKSFRKLAAQLQEQRSNVLTKVDRVTTKVYELASQIKAQKTRAKKAEGKKKETLSELLAVLVERPYTRVSIASGVMGYIAARVPSGQTVLERFVSEDVAISKKIAEAVPKSIAELMLKSAVEEFKEYSLGEGPAREQLPSGAFGINSAVE